MKTIISFANIELNLFTHQMLLLLAIFSYYTHRIVSVENYVNEQTMISLLIHTRNSVQGKSVDFLISGRKFESP